MTVNATIVKQVFTCNGSLYEFDFNFPIDDSDDLKVQVKDADGVVTDLEIVSQYEVSTDEIDFSNGGTITTVSYSSGTRQVYPFPNGTLLAAYRKTPLVQGSSYKNNRTLNQDVLENDFDKACMQLQEFDERLNRAIVVPIEETGSLQLPEKTLRANAYLAFDSNGDPMASAGIAGVTVSSFMEPVVQADTAQEARDLLGVKSELNSVKTVLDTYTALTTDDTLLCSSSAGFTLTLFSVVGNTGKRLTIINVGTGAITIDGNGSETIGGAATQTLNYQYNNLVIESDGSNWQIVGLSTGCITTEFIRDLQVTEPKIAASVKDPIASMAGLRTLGTGAQQACAGNDARLSILNNSVTAEKLYANKSVGLSVPSSNTPLQVSADTSRATNSTIYIKLKEIKIPKGGTLRIEFTLVSGHYQVYAYGLIGRNGTIVGVERKTTDTITTFAEEISGWTENDLCQLYCKCGNSIVSATISNFRIYASEYLVQMD